MIIALLALALAMILGGLLAAFFGWDIVLVERGWTMVIAGSVMAASGAILLGITAVVSKLKQIERGLSRLQGGIAADGLGLAPSAAGALAGAGLAGGLAAGQANADADDGRTDENQPALPLFEEDKPEREDVTVSIAEWPEEREAAPVIPFPPRTTPTSPSTADEEEPAMRVPDFLLADRAHGTAEDALVLEDAESADDRHVQDDRESETIDPTRRDESPEPTSGPEPAAEMQADDEPAAEADDEPSREAETSSGEAASATVIGTYNSGDNQYVMFSDGSIEAQTPSGIFRFKSLDELKEFIAAGGEGNSSASI